MSKLSIGEFRKLLLENPRIASLKLALRKILHLKYCIICLGKSNYMSNATMLIFVLPF